MGQKRPERQRCRAAAAAAQANTSDKLVTDPVTGKHPRSEDQGESAVYVPELDLDAPTESPSKRQCTDQVLPKLDANRIVADATQAANAKVEKFEAEMRATFAREAGKYKAELKDEIKVQLKKELQLELQAPLSEQMETGSTASTVTSDRESQLMSFFKALLEKGITEATKGEKTSKQIVDESVETMRKCIPTHANSDTKSADIPDGFEISIKEKLKHEVAQRVEASLKLGLVEMLKMDIKAQVEADMKDEFKSMQIDIDEVRRIAEEPVTMWVVHSPRFYIAAHRV